MGNAIVWLKNSKSTFSTRLDTVKEKSNGLEDIAEEVMQAEVLRDKEIRNVETSGLWNMEWEGIGCCLVNIPEGENSENKEIQHFKK